MYSGLNESIVNTQKTQLIFGVSFCDIPYKDTKIHRQCYGNYGLVMEKDWGIKNGISPVRYIHKNAPGTNELYLKIKKNTHDINHYYQAENDFDYPILYLLSLVVLYDSDKGNLNYKKVITSKEVEKHREEFIEFYKFLQEHRKYAELLTKYMEVYTYRLSELHNELHHRDVYMRNYSENFICPNSKKHMKEKIIYNEREWRAVKIITLPSKSSKLEYEKLMSFVKQNHLPMEYNLKFSDKDIFAILIENKEDKNEIIKGIKKNSLINSNKIKDKFFLVDEFQNFCGKRT